MANKVDDYLNFNTTALNLRAQRQQLLASNIANADTPNFKARDMDFSKALQNALGNASSAASVSGGIAKTNAAHLDAKNSAGLAGPSAVLYRGNGQGAVDGNTVDMDAERNQFTDNALRYEAGVNLISAQIKGLLSAIQG